MSRCRHLHLSFSMPTKPPTLDPNRSVRQPNPQCSDCHRLSRIIACQPGGTKVQSAGSTMLTMPSLILRWHQWLEFRSIYTLRSPTCKLPTQPYDNRHSHLDWTLRPLAKWQNVRVLVVSTIRRRPLVALALCRWINCRYILTTAPRIPLPLGRKRHF